MSSSGICKTYGSNNISNIPPRLRKVHSDTEIRSVRVGTTVFEQCEAKWSSTGIIERVRIHIKRLGDPFTAHLCVGVILCNRIQASCVITHTLCTALTEPTGCVCVCACGTKA